MFKQMSKHKLMRCSKTECCNQWRQVKFKGTMKKWPAQKQTHRTAHKHVKIKTQLFYLYM